MAAKLTEQVFSLNAGFQSLLSEEQLSEQGQLTLKAAQLLSTWCLLTTRALEHGKGKEKSVATEPGDLMEKLLDLFQPEVTI